MKPQSRTGDAKLVVGGIAILATAVVIMVYSTKAVFNVASKAISR